SCLRGVHCVPTARICPPTVRWRLRWYSAARSTPHARPYRNCCEPSRRIRSPGSKRATPAAVLRSRHFARRRCVLPACTLAELPPQLNSTEDPPSLTVDRCPFPVVWHTPATIPTRTPTPTRTGPTPTPTAHPRRLES